MHPGKDLFIGIFYTSIARKEAIIKKSIPSTDKATSVESQITQNNHL